MGFALPSSALVNVMLGYILSAALAAGLWLFVPPSQNRTAPPEITSSTGVEPPGEAAIEAEAATAAVTSVQPDSQEAEEGPAQQPQEAATQLPCDRAKSLAGRTLSIDTTGGPHFGSLQFRQGLPLAEKEVVLTFDDGPHPQRTTAVLDVLDQHCAKAVFFLVGTMALHHPELVQEIARRGHVIGTHSFSHPRSLPHLALRDAMAEIERGFAAVSYAVGGPVAPLFRFPGLNQSPELLGYMEAQEISVWSVDVVSGDSELVGARHLPDVLLRRLDSQGRGILLFHDTKKATADSLALILERMKVLGYSVVQVTVPASFTPDELLLSDFVPHIQQQASPHLHQVSGKIR